MISALEAKAGTKTRDQVAVEDALERAEYNIRSSMRRTRTCALVRTNLTSAQRLMFRSTLEGLGYKVRALDDDSPSAGASETDVMYDLKWDHA